MTKSYPPNRRKSTRYVRSDIGVTVKKISFFKFRFTKDWGIAVKLIDISSRGLLIASPIRLTVNKKIQLNIRFSDFKEFSLPATIAWKTTGNELCEYGVKFDRVDDGLANYLVKTQRRLKFK